MTLKNKTATVFGGTGFVGRQVVRELADRGVRIKVATRLPERAYFLRPCGTVGQIVPVQCDYSDDASLTQAIKDSDYVINTIGILYEKGKNRFDAVHTDLPKRIAKICKKQKVLAFTHISALGIDQSNAKYAKSKRAGEDAILKAFPKATILRPSIIFGPEDSFFNKFATLSRFLPALPLIGGGHTIFQPVYVGDVADAVINSLTNSDAQGKTYELGGPDRYSFKDIYKLIFKVTGRKRALVPLPFCVAKIDGALFSILPNPPLTMDQVELLKTDNIVEAGALTLKDLSVEPTSADMILPQYLSRFGPEGQPIENAA